MRSCSYLRGVALGWRPYHRTALHARALRSSLPHHLPLHTITYATMPYTIPHHSAGVTVEFSEEVADLFLLFVLHTCAPPRRYLYDSLISVYFVPIILFTLIWVPSVVS